VTEEPVAAPGGTGADSPPPAPLPPPGADECGMRNAECGITTPPGSAAPSSFLIPHSSFRTAGLALAAGAVGIALVALAGRLAAGTAWGGWTAPLLAAILLVAGYLGRSALRRRAVGGPAAAPLVPAGLADEARGLAEGLLAALVLLVPLSLTLGAWGALFGLDGRLHWPADGPGRIASAVLLFALPEELFFRGFLQQALDERWGRPWRIGETWRWGPGVPAAALLFALAHLAVWRSPVALAVFFPGLLFGLLYSKRGAVLAAAALHAACNVAWMLWGGGGF